MTNNLPLRTHENLWHYFSLEVHANNLSQTQAFLKEQPLSPYPMNFDPNESFSGVRQQEVGLSIFTKEIEWTIQKYLWVILGIIFRPIQVLLYFVYFVIPKVLLYNLRRNLHDHYYSENLTGCFPLIFWEGFSRKSFYPCCCYYFIIVLLLLSILFFTQRLVLRSSPNVSIITSGLILLHLSSLPNSWETRDENLYNMMTKVVIWEKLVLSREIVSMDSKLTVAS